MGRNKVPRCERETCRHLRTGDTEGHFGGSGPCKTCTDCPAFLGPLKALGRGPRAAATPTSSHRRNLAESPWRSFSKRG